MAKKTTKRKVSKKKSVKSSKKKTVKKKVSASSKLKKHKYHHHIRKSIFIFAILTIILIVAIVASYYYQAYSNSGTLAKITAYGKTVKVTQTEVDTQYNKLPEQYKAFVSKTMILEQLINEQVFLFEAEKKGVVITTNDIDKAINQTLTQAGVNSSQLNKSLAAQGLTLSDLKTLYSKQLKITKLIEKEVIPQINISDTQLKTAYNSQIRARHILVANKSDADKIISDLQAGASFTELANTKSIDTAAKGGDLGVFGKGQMVKEFEEAAFALKENELTSSPVKTNFGFHVIQRLPKSKTFEESKESLKKSLQSQLQNTYLSKYLTGLKAKMKINILSSKPVR